VTKLSNNNRQTHKRTFILTAGTYFSIDGTLYTQCSCEHLSFHDQFPINNVILCKLQHIWCGYQNGIFAWVTHVLMISNRCGTLNFFRIAPQGKSRKRKPRDRDIQPPVVARSIRLLRKSTKQKVHRKIPKWKTAE
jgi:hypothetical protein